MSRVRHLCEHHREGTEPVLRRDPALPDPWRVAECPVCGYWCEMDPTTGEVRPA